MKLHPLHWFDWIPDGEKGIVLSLCFCIFVIGPFVLIVGSLPHETPEPQAVFGSSVIVDTAPDVPAQVLTVEFCLADPTDPRIVGLSPFGEPCRDANAHMHMRVRYGADEKPVWFYVMGDPRFRWFSMPITIEAPIGDQHGKP